MAEFWQPTAQLFGSLFEKPKMSQKLLEKPPFKYLFDIVIETTKTTGFGKGLYTAEELDPNFYDSKERKTLFLKKIIDVTQLMLKEQIASKPGKIVAGLEPENTNLMLQAIYRAAISGQSSDPFVKKVLQAESGEPQQKQDPPKEQQKQDPKQQQAQQKPQPEVKAKPQEQPAPKQQLKPKEQPKEEPEPVKPLEKKALPQKQEPQKQEQPQIKKKPEDPKPVQQEKPQQQAPVQQVQANQSVVERPSTAKRRPPKLASNQVEEHGPKKASGTANVIMDKVNDNFDDDIQQDQVPTMVQPQANLNTQQHGKFIRGAAKQAEEASENVDVKKEETTQEGESKIKLGRLGGKKNAGKGGVKAQVAQNLGTSQVPDTVVLQTLVQQICQSANPLGKSLEFIQDDIESMNHELAQWRKIYETSKVKLVEMNKATEDAQQPLYDKIAEVEESVREKRTKIQNLKAQIIKNKFTVESLLKSVVIQK